MDCHYVSDGGVVVVVVVVVIMYFHTVAILAQSQFVLPSEIVPMPALKRPADNKMDSTGITPKQRRAFNAKVFELSQEVVASFNEAKAEGHQFRINAIMNFVMSKEEAEILYFLLRKKT